METFRFAHVEDDSLRRVRVAQSLMANVGDAVAFRISPARPWAPGDIDTQRIGCAQAGTFADQSDSKAWLQQPADLIPDGYASLAHNAHWA